MIKEVFDKIYIKIKERDAKNALVTEQGKIADETNPYFVATKKLLEAQEMYYAETKDLPLVKEVYEIATNLDVLLKENMPDIVKQRKELEALIEEYQGRISAIYTLFNTKLFQEEFVAQNVMTKQPK